MLEVLERVDRLFDDRVGGHVVQSGDHADAARVVLEARVVEPDGRRLQLTHSHCVLVGAPCASGALRSDPPTLSQAGT